MNLKHQAIAITTFVQIFSMTQIAHSTSLPACLEGYAFYGDQGTLVRLDWGETGNGNLGSNSRRVHFDKNTHRPWWTQTEAQRTWNGDIKSHGGVDVHDVTINGNVLSGGGGFKGATDNIWAHNGYRTFINGNVSLPQNGFIWGHVQINGTVQIGGNGSFVGEDRFVDKAFINGNYYVGGNADLTWSFIKGGGFFIGGDYTNSWAPDINSCALPYQTLYLGGKPGPFYPCQPYQPLPSPSPFPPIVDVPKCELTSDSIKVGVNNFYIKPNDKAVLTPGLYKSVGIAWADPIPDVNPIPGTTDTFRQNGCLQLSSGSYSMQSLFVPNGTCLELNTADGNIEVNVRDTLLLKGTNPIRFVGVEDPSKFKIYFAGEERALKLRTDGHGSTDTLPNRFVGTFYAPNSEIELVDYTIMGAVYAKEVSIFGRFKNQSIPYIPGPMASPTAKGKVRKQILSSSQSRTKVYKINGAAEAGTGTSRGRVFQNSRP